MNEIPCPTCGAVGIQQCVRGRKPISSAGIFGAVWTKQIPFPEGHDSRRTVNKERNLEILLEIADEVNAKVQAGIFPPKDASGQYVFDEMFN